jgi:hypothetical protein
MSDPKPAFAAAFVQIKYSDDYRIAFLSFYDPDGQIPHVVSLPRERWGNFLDQVQSKLSEGRAPAPRG